MILTEEKRDRIMNALLVGMAKEDAYMYAGLTNEEITALADDYEWNREVNMRSKSLEYSLLNNMHRIADKQIKMGRTDATTWLLEKLYPRYSAKPTNEMPTINLQLNTSDDTLAHTEIHHGH